MSGLSLIQGAPQTMSSREIAELTGKDHKHVLRDIRVMFAELGEDESKFGRIYRDTMNREQTELHLNRELTDCLLTGYSATARLKVIKRWHELEAQATDPARMLSDPAILRNVLLGYTEKVIELESKVQTMAPKVQAFDQIAESEGLINLANAAKNLGIPPHEFNKKLNEMKWIYKRHDSGKWIANQEKIKAGCVVSKLVYYIGRSGTKKSTVQVMVTPFGVTKLSLMFGGGPAQMQLI
jgi:phage antirepressor YoqD-like protein